MSAFFDSLGDRFLVFSIRIIELERPLCKSFSGKHIYNQMFRAGTSAGANFEEARAGESKADFIHKMQVVLKELREAKYWISLVKASELCKNIELLDNLLNESIELANITARSILTAKSNKEKTKDTG